MKATGIVRRIDGVGRFVIPSELRDLLGMTPDTPVELYLRDNSIILAKHNPYCIGCGVADGEKALRQEPLCGEWDMSQKSWKFRVAAPRPRLI